LTRRSRIIVFAFTFPLSQTESASFAGFAHTR